MFQVDFLELVWAERCLTWLCGDVCERLGLGRAVEALEGLLAILKGKPTTLLSFIWALLLRHLDSGVLTGLSRHVRAVVGLLPLT